MPSLRLTNVSKVFGGIKAISDLDMDVHEGEILGLIGPNGAGKTTVFNVITGFLRVSGGKIFFKDHEITNQAPSRITQIGISRTFQQNLAFENMSTLENIMIAAHCRNPISKWQSLVKGDEYKKRMERIHQVSRETAKLLGLADFCDQKARSLSHGHRKRLGVAAALACGPGMLLLDEPFAGMLPGESDRMAAEIKDIAKNLGLTVIIIEHEMRVVMSLCERIIVLNFGRKLAEGNPETIKNNQEVIDAYLGK
jgi:branched-chain amino acid transport system ATP-binding protein